MNLSELQADLRHFAAERDWQPFHTPKNLSTALMVESAELAEIFQWMTPEQSGMAHKDAGVKQSISDEVADVLLYLLQVADHCEINVEQAVRDKLARNGLKYAVKRRIARVSTTRASAPGTHVLLDYENVQPNDGELRSLVPDAGQVWVFHGPHQRQVEHRFPSFGANVTAVPISKTGKNALDFHLSFYMGYIASRNPASTMVVVANDKGYEPMLEHAKAMGFVVRRQSHGVVNAATKKTPTKKVVARKSPAKKAAAKPAAKPAPAKKAVTKKVVPLPAAEKTVAAKVAPAKKATPPNKPATKATAPTAVKVATALPPALVSGPAIARPSPPARPSTASDSETSRIVENLRKLGVNRPTKSASLRRLLKSFLATETEDPSIDVALSNLVAAGVVAIGARSEVSYPAFEAQPSAGSLTP